MTNMQITKKLDALAGCQLSNGQVDSLIAVIEEYTDVEYAFRVATNEGIITAAELEFINSILRSNNETNR